MVKPVRLNQVKTSSTTWNKKPKLDPSPILKARKKLLLKKIRPVQA